MSGKKKKHKKSDEEVFKKKELKEEQANPNESKGNDKIDTSTINKDMLDKELHMIYNVDEEETDFSKLEQRKSNRFARFLIWLIITLFILSGAAWAGYILFQKQFAGSEKEFTIEIEGADEITSGEVVQYDIVYDNKGSDPIAALEIQLSYPEGFTVTEMNPSPNSGEDTWNIGSLTAGSDGLIRLKGVWIDPVPSGKNIQAIATYRPANFNSDFQDIATKAVAIRDSALQLEVEAPDRAVPGKNESYVFKIKNNSTEQLNDIRIRVEIPDNFLVNKADPEPIESEHEWIIGSLEADQESELTINGSFADDASGLISIPAQVGILRDNTFLEQNSVNTKTDVLGGELSVRLIINGSTETQSVNLGSTLRLSIDVINGGDEDVNGLSVSLNLTGSKSLPIDWENADLRQGVKSNESITWSAENLINQGLLSSNNRETIDLTLPLLDELNNALDSMVFTVSASVNEIAGVEASRTLQSTPLTILINSDTSLNTAAHYYIEDLTVGNGPLPPTVDDTTVYRIVWNISNSLHALNDVSVTTTIPPNVEFKKVIETDIGTMNFDEAGRILSWNIARLPTNISKVSGSFDLAITPTVEDIGKFVKLTNETIMVASDEKTESRLQRNNEIVSTDISDVGAEDKGVVVE